MENIEDVGDGCEWVGARETEWVWLESWKDMDETERSTGDGDGVLMRTCLVPGGGGERSGLLVNPSECGVSGVKGAANERKEVMEGLCTGAGICRGEGRCERGILAGALSAPSAADSLKSLSGDGGKTTMGGRVRGRARVSSLDRRLIGWSLVSKGGSVAGRINSNFRSCLRSPENTSA